MKDLILQARKEILVNRDNQKALSLFVNMNEKELSEEEKKAYKRTLGLIYLESGEYKKSAEIYKESGENYQAGFCELLTGNENEAERLWNIPPDTGPCFWGRCLLDFINMRKTRKPSYLQVRNHLEIDIGYFIQANKLKYAENLIKNDDVFISVNLESYKLIGKVLLNYGFLNMAKKYFLKSLDIISADAETMYYLGRCNYAIGAYKESRLMLDRCLEHNNSYTPARNLIAKIETKVSNT